MRSVGSHACHAPSTVAAPPGARKIVLVGNPNVGKSLFFNAFTGMHVDVSNFPGTTVAVSSGHMGDDVVLDTPGIYGVSSFNDEETVARDIVMEADVIINVVDAVHLERDLFLTQQIIDMGIPVVVALNMVDEAEARGVIVDTDELSRLLGVPVVRTVAIRREGFDEVRAALEEARVGCSDHALQDRLTALLDRVGTRPEALLVLEGDPYVAERHGVSADAAARRDLHGSTPARQRHRRTGRRPRHGAASTCAPASATPSSGRSPASPCWLSTLYLMYEIIGVFVAGRVVGFTEGTLMQGYVEPFLRSLVQSVTGPTGARLRDPRGRVRRHHADGHLHLRAACCPW